MHEETMSEVHEILRRVFHRAITINWRSSQSMPGAGERRSHYRGSGDDFDGLDEYGPGDDPRAIDWNATAQTGGQTILKTVHIEPRDVKVFILTDVGPSMDFGTARATKRHLAAELAASIIKAADETHDRVGFVSYTKDKLGRYMPSGAAGRLLLPATVSIVDGERAAERAGSGTGSGLIKALSLLPPSRSLVFVISDFLHPSEKERLALRKASFKHDVVCLIVQDRRERELPAVWGFYTLEDLGTGQRKTIFVTKAVRERFAENFRKHDEELESFFRQANCRWLPVSTEEGDAAIPRLLRLYASGGLQDRRSRRA